MTITNPSSSLIRAGSLTGLPPDIFESIGGYLDNKDQRVLAAVCKIFKATYDSSLFDRIIPGDPEKGEPLTISRLIPAHQALASAMCAMRANNIARFQQPIYTLENPGYHFPHVLSSDGQTIITSTVTTTDTDTETGNYIIKIYDTETGVCTRTLFGHTETITALALSPDGKALISGSVGGALKIWDIETGTCTRSQETAPPKELPNRARIFFRNKYPFEIQSIMITPDKKSFISTSRRGLIQIWDIETGTCKKTLMDHRDQNILITPDKKKFIALAKSEGKSADVFVIGDIETGERKQTLDAYSTRVQRIDITPNGRYLISQQDSSIYDPSPYNIIAIYDLETSLITQTLENLQTTPFALTPNGKKVIATFHDDTIKIYDIETTKCKSIPLEPNIETLAITPDGASLIAHFGYRGTRIYDIESLACLHTMASNRRHSQITLASDGRTFLLGGGCSIEIWKLHPLLEEVMASSGKASPKEIARYALLDTSQYLKMIAERKDRPSSNLCSSAMQFAINRIWSLPPEIQQELYREYRTPTLTEGPVASFVRRINELPEEMQELFSAKLEEAASQEPRTPLSLPPELA